MLNGKINVIFGFIYLAATAVLGPTVLVPNLYGNLGQLEEAGKAVETVRQGTTNDFQGVKNPDTVIGDAVVKSFDFNKGRLYTVSLIAGGVHAHGNLEALLNIVAGVVLLSLAIPATYKSLLSIIFLVGALFHSGMLYLAQIFNQAWAWNLTSIGAYAILAGLILLGVASAVGLKQQGS